MLLDVLNRLKANSEICEENEETVRTQLVNPILNEIGWDVSNPNHVKLNKKINSPSKDKMIPDYALMNDKGKTILIVEAKCLNADLSKHIRQLSNYCYNENIRFGFLTNGVEWMLVNTFKAPAFEDRIVWTVDLNGDLDVFVKKLSMFSYENRDNFEKQFEDNALIDDSLSKMSFDEFGKVVDTLAGKLLDNIKKKNPNFSISKDKLKSYTERRIFNLLEAKMEEDDSRADSDSKEALTNDIIFSNARKDLISVTFPDGSRICCPKVADTFCKVIQKIGFAKVAELKIMHADSPIVTNERFRYKDYQTVWKMGEYFIMTHSSTNDKIEILEEINTRLGLDLEINKIPKQL